MTIQEFAKKYLGKGIDFDGSNGNQCVDLFRQYNKEVLEIKQPKGVIGAVDFYTKFESDPILGENFMKIPNTPTGVPQESDVMIWDQWTGNPYGHVAIFITGDANKFISLDQNWNNVKKVQEIEHSYTKPKVLGWLRPKKLVVANPCEELQKEYDELRAKWNKRDKEFDKINAENKELKKELDKLTTEFEQAVADLRKNNAEWKGKYEELGKVNEALLKETKLWNAIKKFLFSFNKKNDS